MKKFIFLTITILWISFIFYNSLQTAIDSSQSSSIIVNFVNKLISLIDINIKLSVLSLIIRKLAHMFEFFVLSILFQFLLINYKKFSLLLLVLFCSLIALIDEGIQFFIEGRSSSIIDVFIDLFGSITGYFSFLLVKSINNKFKFNRKKAI